MSHANPCSRPPHHRVTLPVMRRRVTSVAALGVLAALGACLDSSVTPTVAGLTPASMVLVTGDAQLGAAGNTLPIPVTVRVVDQSGLPVAYTTVTFAPTASSGTVSAMTLYTDTTGSAGVSWTLGAALGSDSLSVSVPGLPAITVTATVTSGAPDSITVVSGGAQAAPAGATLSAPLVVRVTDHFGNAVPNATVRWSSDANGGYAFASASSVTDADGRAQAVYTLGAVAGLQHVTVIVSTAAGAMLATISETGT